jgi:choline dehydrogenase-like flavoprotein
MSVPNEATTYDVVIIGAGTAGCVLANRLSQDEHLSVAIIEAGTDKSNDTVIKAPPGASPSLIGDSIYVWVLKTTE